jgi:Arc/MetJ family transcription regulator
MRTNVIIDDALMKKALQSSGLHTKKAAIEEGLKLLVKLGQQRKIRALRGKLNWSGHLNDMRNDS